jgi:hypothetical protein
MFSGYRYVKTQINVSLVLRNENALRNSTQHGGFSRYLSADFYVKAPIVISKLLCPVI